MKKFLPLFLLGTMAWPTFAQKIIEKTLPFSNGQ
jgi:hypothetical protein